MQKKYGEILHLHGDNIEHLQKYPDNFFSAVVTDSPYGLGKEPDALQVMRDWIEKGYHEVKGTGFMGKSWDAFIPQPLFWKEVFRVLKPGGHVVSFFGTRTYDWGVMAMRFAGFEIRDKIQFYFDDSELREAFLESLSKEQTDIFSQIMRNGENSVTWCFGSGFPKSLNVSAAIDKAAGAERKVISVKETKSGGMANVNKVNKDQGFRPNNYNEHGNTFEVTEPATDAAKQFSGFGTAIKPANEPIVLARKPLEKGLNVAQNVLKWGTGALNIDAARISFKNAADYEESTVKNQHADFGTKPMTDNNVYGDYSMMQPKNYQPEGRWPANLILSHSSQCVCLGAKKVKGQIDKPTNRTEKGQIWNEENSGLRNNLPANSGGFADADGFETVEEWECVDGKQFTLPCFSSMTFALKPSYDSENLLHQLKSSIDLMKKYSMNYKIPSLDAYEACHTSYIQSEDFSFSLSHEASRVLGMSEFLSSPLNYLFYPHFCDELVHKALTSSQQSSLQLIDVLEHVYSGLLKLLHSHNNQYLYRLSSFDDFLQLCISPDTDENKTSSFSSSRHNTNTLLTEQEMSDKNANTSSNNIVECDNYGKYYRSADISDCIKLLVFLSIDLAYLGYEDLIQKYQINIKTPICPVKMMDEQSGVSKSTVDRNLSTQTTSTWFAGNEHNRESRGDEGTASRFFYCAKTSQWERSWGLDNLKLFKLKKDVPEDIIEQIKTYL